MNNIIVKNNKVEDYEDDYILILDNVITFKKSCDCNINYINVNDLNIEINLLDNVYVKLFEYSADLKIKTNFVYNINDNATLLLYKFYSNEDVFENILINLNGYMSKINYNFSNICINEEKYNFIIKHNNSNSVSDISNKAICLENAKIDFNIDTIVEKGNTKCSLNQDTKIINIKDNNSIVKPNMYISEDDVQARHSSVIANFNEDDLFYLMTRGISRIDAIKLLVKGYIFSNLVVDIEQRSKILNIISKYWR